MTIPSKRYDRRPVSFLTTEETNALVAAPDVNTWIGRRDRALLLVAVQTGLRNSEITSLRRQDVEFGAGAHVRCLGKGRKMRCTPLRRDIADALKEWLSQQGGNPEDYVFPSSNGGRLSADAFQRLVQRHIARARRTCPSLRSKTVTPHTLRHAAAMAMLRRGVDLSVIALGSVTNRLRLLKCICTPTWNSNNEPWLTPTLRALYLHASGLPTRCSLFWRACDYADKHRPEIRDPSPKGMHARSSQRYLKF